MKRELYTRLAIIIGLVLCLLGGYYVQTHPYRQPVDEVEQQVDISNALSAH